MVHVPAIVSLVTNRCIHPCAQAALRRRLMTPGADVSAGAGAGGAAAFPFLGTFPFFEGFDLALGALGALGALDGLDPFVFSFFFLPSDASALSLTNSLHGRGKLFLVYFGSLRINKKKHTERTHDSLDEQVYIYIYMHANIYPSRKSGL